MRAESKTASHSGIIPLIDDCLRRRLALLHPRWPRWRGADFAGAGTWAKGTRESPCDELGRVRAGKGQGVLQTLPAQDGGDALDGFERGGVLHTFRETGAEGPGVGGRRGCQPLLADRGLTGRGPQPRGVGSRSMPRAYLLPPHVLPVRPQKAFRSRRETCTKAQPVRCTSWLLLRLPRVPASKLVPAGRNHVRQEEPAGAPLCPLCPWAEGSCRAEDAELLAGSSGSKRQPRRSGLFRGPHCAFAATGIASPCSIAASLCATS
jgi:hypothetical protein